MFILHYQQSCFQVNIRTHKEDIFSETAAQAAATGKGSELSFCLFISVDDFTSLDDVFDELLVVA